MDKIIKNVLENLENNGYEAYIIGGYVRDLLVGLKNYDIDIATNATPKDLINLFPNSSSKNLGGIDFKINEYHFEITTYREEIKYVNRKPVEFNYVSNLLTDLERRDFTVNTICMNINGEVIDLLNGTKDIQDKCIRMVGNIKTKIKEDPLRILRGIRIATQLNFNIESNLYKEFKNMHDAILTLSNTRIREELDKILLADNVRKGLKLLEEIGIIKDLGITVPDNIVPVKNIEGMYAQIKIDYQLPFRKEEKNNIACLKEILNLEEITDKIIYKYGLYLCTIASDIMGIDKKVINKLHQDLVIHDKSEIAIETKDLIKKYNISGKEISDTIKKLEELIITNKIPNNESDIIKYLNMTILNI